jgi:hypothetical protein
MKVQPIDRQVIEESRWQLRGMIGIPDQDFDQVVYELMKSNPIAPKSTLIALITEVALREHTSGGHCLNPHLLDLTLFQAAAC